MFVRIPGIQMNRVEVLIEFRSAEFTNEKTLFNSKDFRVRVKNLMMLETIHPSFTITRVV